MEEKPTLQTLKLDCLLEVLSYVPLPECMFLRSSCRHLKTAVDEHFRTGVKTLPVLLSGRYDLYDIDVFNQYCEGTLDLQYARPNCEKVTFGSASGVSQWRMWEKKDSHFGLNHHFRRENYLVLFNNGKFRAFVDFITKYLPNVTKLALLIDYSLMDLIFNIPSILKVYQNQLKVLSLERTYRSRMIIRVEESEYEDSDTDDIVIVYRPLYRDTHVLLEAYEDKLWLSDEFYRSINGLDALEELYFFTESSYRPNDEDDPTAAHQFMNRMFSKLRVLHITCDIPSGYNSDFCLQSQSYEKLEELACYSPKIFTENKASFPLLKKCIFYQAAEEDNGGDWLDRKLMPKLKDIRHILPRNG